MTGHKVHETLPSGFTYADRLQRASFEATGSVAGATKVCLVKIADKRFAAYLGRDSLLAVRLGPPRFMKSVLSDARHEYEDVADYVADYQEGWRHGLRARAEGERLPLSEYGTMSQGEFEGATDAINGRPKWHTPHCAEHLSERGCGA